MTCSNSILGIFFFFYISPSELPSNGSVPAHWNGFSLFWLITGAAGVINGSLLRPVALVIRRSIHSPAPGKLWFNRGGHPDPRPSPPAWALNHEAFTWQASINSFIISLCLAYNLKQVKIKWMFVHINERIILMQLLSFNQDTLYALFELTYVDVGGFKAQQNYKFKSKNVFKCKICWIRNFFLLVNACWIKME